MAQSDQASLKRSLDALLRPRSVVLFGATPETSTLAGGFLRNLVRGGYDGKIYPVNPKYEAIGELLCHKDLAALPDQLPLDLAVLLVGPNRVLPLLEQCGEAGIGAAIVLSANFGEAGDEEGHRRQAQLADIVRRTGIRVCGPNSLGVINQAHQLVAFGSLSVPNRFPRGRLAVVSQSGGLATLAYNRHRPLGFSYLISTGNQGDLELGDYLLYLAEDPEVGAIAAFLEGVKTAPRFIAGCRRALACGKPVVVLKVGRSSRGAAAAISHTGSLTGADAAWNATLCELGIVRVNDPDELFEVAHCLASVPPAVNDGVAVAALSGGVGGIMADQAEDHGLYLPNWRAEAITSLEALGYHVFGNPFDANGLIPIHPERLCQSLSILAREPEIGVLVAALAPASGRLGERLAADLIALRSQTEQPLLTVWPGGEPVRAGLRMLAEAGIPCFSRLDTALLAVKALVAQRRRPAAEPQRRPAIPAEAQATARQLIAAAGTHPVLGESESKELLAGYGIPVTRQISASSAEAAVAAATAIGYPVVLKVDSPHITHKTEAGGVRLGLKDSADVMAAFNDITAAAKAYNPKAKLRSVLVQEQVSGVAEAFIGGQVDPQLGPCVVFGLGGIFVEILQDVVMRPAPLDLAAASEMVRAIKGLPLLTGARGRPPADLDGLADALVRASWLLHELQDVIAEFDMNPIATLAVGAGVRVLDARVVLRRTERQPEGKADEKEHIQ